MVSAHENFLSFQFSVPTPCQKPQSTLMWTKVELSAKTGLVCQPHARRYHVDLGWAMSKKTVLNCWGIERGTSNLSVMVGAVRCYLSVRDGLHHTTSNGPCSFVQSRVLVRCMNQLYNWFMQFMVRCRKCKNSVIRGPPRQGYILCISIPPPPLWGIIFFPTT